MPELPEVELVTRSLDKLIQGRTFVSAELLRPRLVPATRPDLFAETLRSRRVNYVRRRGKHILFDLSGGVTLLVHLRMSGRFSLRNGDEGEPKFTHAVFGLDDGKKLIFYDQRHFGFMKIIATNQLSHALELKKLAPEPLSDDFSRTYLARVLRKSRQPIKEFLIDQAKVCGLGNIYACEALFLAGIAPTRTSSRLSRLRSDRLHSTIRQILDEAISRSLQYPMDPTDIGNSYFNGSSRAGWYVYGREGQPCVYCDRPIVRVKQGGRSSFYCRKCQR